MGRCTQCVLPVTFREVAFDGDGVCSICRASAHDHPQGEPGAGARSVGELEAQIEGIRARGVGRPFDCIVGLSGGRDSTYLLYLLIKKHGLRCLAAYYRTPFTPNAIDANVRRLVRQLGVELEEIRVSKEYHRRIAREIVSLWVRKPDPILANLACAPCKRVNSELLAIARRHRVGTMAVGVNRFESVQLAASIPRNVAPTTKEDAQKQNRVLAQAVKMMVVLRRGVQTLFKHRALWRYLPLGLHSSLLAVAPNTLYLRMRYPGIRVFDYFNYAEWSERELERALAEVGWELPPGCRSTWRADCSFADLKDLMFLRSMGLSYVDAMLSNMVRAGAISRDEALARLRAGAGLSPSRVAEAIETLELPREMAAELTPRASELVTSEPASIPAPLPFAS